ncbi:Fic/DOC family protein [Desulfocapsa sulfexigens DSM 10523]|uniref:Fic/DOC family protein n=1 Tax=Desulfocapsa sulfexigens (strain DSM 10523 / SB164P1) TaxID=1167006 RepID=M1P9C2_DESSD|nr:virulence protein RhuM/Fic/DOC family protein [Desulfocapsa sulfexigens]AGF80043.1 Fic/DOC family protein [Desulfocapsa sulfexigens DSM 10523]
MTFEQGELILYQFYDGKVGVDVRLKDESVWLTLNQISDLFERDKSVISRHLRNIFQSGELVREATVAENATVQQEGTREVSRIIEWFNLDAIISVGYRVNSKRGTQFRIWATSILKEHLVQGCTLNQKRLAEKGLDDARQMLGLLANTLEDHKLVNDEGRGVLSIVTAYAKTWQLLWQYDEASLAIPKSMDLLSEALEIDQARPAISSLKQELLSRSEATGIFGQERGEGLAGVLGAIQQTFGGQDLYPSVQEKAANLLYFIIKDHPFVDGNKRIGSFLFLLFLRLNRDVLDFDDKALVALTLLIASSDPAQKDLLIRLVINLLTNEKG